MPLHELLTEPKLIHSHTHYIIAGGNDGSGDLNTVLEHDLDEDKIKTKSQMTETRSLHAISEVKFADYSQWCEW